MCETKETSKPLTLNLLKKRLSYHFIFYTENITNSLSYNKMTRVCN